MNTDKLRVITDFEKLDAELQNKLNWYILRDLANT